MAQGDLAVVPERLGILRIFPMAMVLTRWVGPWAWSSTR